MIYLVTFPIIIYFTISITFLNTKIQRIKEKYQLDYPRYYQDVSILRWFFSKVLNCTFCLSGHMTWITLLISGYSLFYIVPLTLITMNIATGIEDYIYENDYK